MGASPSLLEVQRLFLNDIGGGRLGSALAPHVLTDGLKAAQRVSIYHDTSITTRVNALRLTFPAVCQLVGEEFFEGVVRAYIGLELPRSAWLDEYGAGFVSFIEQFPQAAPVPYLSDVAALEWAVSQALHAPEAPPIDPQQLAAALAAQCDALRLIAHPAIGLVRTNSPADAIWGAVLASDDAALAAIDLSDRPVYLLVERKLQSAGEPTRNAASRSGRAGQGNGPRAAIERGCVAPDPCAVRWALAWAGAGGGCRRRAVGRRPAG